MAFQGSASSNLSPFLFKGNNRPLSINLIIHRDQSDSMDSFNNFYSDGQFISTMQNLLLSKKIGNRINENPNLYAYFDFNSRRSTSAFTITNSKGSLTISDGFIKGEATGSLTSQNWIDRNYYSIISGRVNICTNLIGRTDTGIGSRIDDFIPDELSEDVHGNLWSIFTTPNAISTGSAGKYGRVISSPIRVGTTTVIITNSDEQASAPVQLLNTLIDVNSTGTLKRTINGTNGELVFRKYKIVVVSSYTSTDNFDGVLFYGSRSLQPYGYVKFNFDGVNHTYTITRSANYPTSWNPISGFQIHNTITLAFETNGALFKISSITNERKNVFASCIADFISNTI